MADVSIRDLRQRAGEIVDLASSGEDVTITRDGKPVAQLFPIPGAALTASTLLERWRGLPPVDPAAWRADMNAAIDSAIP